MLAVKELSDSFTGEDDRFDIKVFGDGFVNQQFEFDIKTVTRICIPEKA